MVLILLVCQISMFSCAKEVTVLDNYSSTIFTVTDSIIVNDLSIDQLYFNKTASVIIAKDAYKKVIRTLSYIEKSVKILATKGRGPGELLNPISFSFNENDILELYDVQRSSMIYFNNDLEYLSETSYKSDGIWLHGRSTYEIDHYKFLGIMDARYADDENIHLGHFAAIFKDNKPYKLFAKLPEKLHDGNSLYKMSINSFSPIDSTFIITWLKDPVIQLWEWKGDTVITKTNEISVYPDLFKISTKRPRKSDDMLTRRKVSSENSTVLSIHKSENKIYLLFSNYTMQGHLEQDSNLFEYFIAIYDLDQEKWVYEKQLDEIALAVDFQHRLYTNKVVGNDSWIKRYQISYED